MSELQSKVVLWGNGGYYKTVHKLVEELENEGKIKVCGMIDDSLLETEKAVYGIPLLAKEELLKLAFDFILITADAAKYSIRNDAVSMGIKHEKIKFLSDFDVMELETFRGLSLEWQMKLLEDRYGV